MPPAPLAFRDLLHFPDLQPSGFRFRLRGHRDDDFENSLMEVSGRLRGLRTFGKRDRAVEAAIAALAVVVSLALFLRLLLALALDRDQAIGDLHLDVVLAQPREIGADHELSLPLQHLDFRRPLRGDNPALAPQQLAAAAEELRQVPPRVDIEGSQPEWQFGGRLEPRQVPTGLDAEILEEVVHLLGEPAHEGERAAVRRDWRGLRAASGVLDLSL